MNKSLITLQFEYITVSQKYHKVSVRILSEINKLAHEDNSTLQKMSISMGGAPLLLAICLIRIIVGIILWECSMIRL